MTTRSFLFQAKFSFLIASLILVSSSLQAEIRLPRIFSDHMVLQRHQSVPIWGWADKGERITVQFQDQVLKTKADKSGKWRVYLASMEAGGPFTLQVSGKKQMLTYENVMIGEVWICSGQSNMEWPLRLINDTEKEISEANYAHIRLFDVERNLQFAPIEDLDQEESWFVCESENMANFSAVGYFFGRHLYNVLNVPIGLISTNWGGTVVETWISQEAISQHAGFENIAQDLDPAVMEAKMVEQKAYYDQLLSKFGDGEAGLIDGKALWAANDLDVSNWANMKLPGLWENQSLKGLDGVVWFRKQIIIPEGVNGQNATLHLGPIDDSDITWINGIQVGSMIDQYNMPREYQIPPDLLKAGENVITVRVDDTGGGGGLWGKPEQMKLVAGKAEIPLHGEWKFRISPVDYNIQQSVMGPNDAPTLLYNGMIHPLLPYAIQGAIWYQGESNAARAHQYRTLFPTMINDWRKQWNRDFPFLFVQLANFKAPQANPVESDWAELREAQSMTLSLPNTGQAVIIDIGEADDIHPRNKQDVGHRLALSALHVAYQQELVHSGPVYQKMNIDGDEIILSFDHVGSGLVAKDRYGYLKGFAIAGEDRIFHWAKAEIHGNQIMVSSPQVENPVAVRYGWADNPDDANLYNQEGLPASPFRTDDWKGITFGQK